MLYVVRHGESALNVLNLMCGITDAEITEKGIGQARETGEKLSKIKFDKVFASPLKRARITAETIVSENEFPVDIQIEPAIIERNFGSREQQPIGELNYYKLTHDAKAEGMETMDEVKARLYPFLDKITKEYSGKNVLIVSHNALIRMLRLYFGEGKDLDDYMPLGIGNAQILKYEI